MTVIYPSPIFGPVHSRRLGVSLGVNLMPADGKICTFDCIYCECGLNAERPVRLPRPTREEVRTALQHKLEEMQAAVRKNGKPTGLRMGANMRRLTEEAKRMIPNMDLFEVGLNADAFTCEDVRWLGEHGIHVFSNLGDYPDWWEKMVTRGVLGFKTNYAAAYTNWWNSRR